MVLQDRMQVEVYRRQSGEEWAREIFTQAVKRGFDMVMLTSDLASMIAGARHQLDDLKATTA